MSCFLKCTFTINLWCTATSQPLMYCHISTSDVLPHLDLWCTATSRPLMYCHISTSDVLPHLNLWCTATSRPLMYCHISTSACALHLSHRTHFTARGQEICAIDCEIDCARSVICLVTKCVSWLWSVFNGFVNFVVKLWFRFQLRFEGTFATYKNGERSSSYCRRNWMSCRSADSRLLSVLTRSWFTDWLIDNCLMLIDN
jgi:hypothetical protein